MSAAADKVGVAEFPGLKRCESPLGHRWWAYGTNNDDEYPLGDYVPAAWLSDAQRERDEARAAVVELIEVVTAAECTCDEGDGRYAAVTCQRCELLARVGAAP